MIGMLEFEDKQIRADTCWAFSYITDGPNERIQMVLDVSLSLLLILGVITVIVNVNNIIAEIVPTLAVVDF